jgi:hypothetical protein
MRNDHGPRADAHIQAHFDRVLWDYTAGDEDEPGGDDGQDICDLPEPDEL